MSRISKTAAYGIAIILLSIAARLPGLSFPREVIFDEVHFGKFVTAYCCTHERIFDIHPPHAKLIIAGVARLGGWQGGFDFEHIGQKYPADTPIVALRLTSALAGILLPLVIFILLRQLKASAEISFLGGMAFVFDNAMVVQSRWVSLDTLLLLATFGSLAAFLAGSRRLVPLETGRQGRPWALMGWFVAAGALAGLAIGVKFTGLTALALVGVLVVVRLVGALRTEIGNRKPEIRVWFTAGLTILMSAGMVYLAGWALHFALLDQPGSGDAWGVPTGHFWQDLTHTQQQMLSANYGLTATHPDSSRWWEWVLMTKSVFYWSGQNSAAIYMLGNPVVWWGSAALFVAAVGGMIGALLKQKSAQQLRAPISNFSRGGGIALRRGQFLISKIWIPLVGFVIAFLPLARVPRALFLYHYLTPLVFSLVFGLLWMSSRVESRKYRVENSTTAAAGPRNGGEYPAFAGATAGRQVSSIKTVLPAMIIIFMAFLFFSPLTYGFTVPEAWHALLFWLPGWR